MADFLDVATGAGAIALLAIGVVDALVLSRVAEETGIAAVVATRAEARRAVVAIAIRIDAAVAPGVTHVRRAEARIFATLARTLAALAVSVRSAFVVRAIVALSALETATVSPSRAVCMLRALVAGVDLVAGLARLGRRAARTGACLAGRAMLFGNADLSSAREDRSEPTHDDDERDDPSRCRTHGAIVNESASRRWRENAISPSARALGILAAEVTDLRVEAARAFDDGELAVCIVDALVGCRMAEVADGSTELTAGALRRRTVVSGAIHVGRARTAEAHVRALAAFLPTCARSLASSVERAFGIAATVVVAA